MTSPYYQNPQKLMLHHYAFYLCSVCKEPFLAGALECRANNEQDEAKETKCSKCLGIKKCMKNHDEMSQIFKCKYCCNVATFRCDATHYFCNPCHDEAGYLWDLASDKMDQTHHQGASKEVKPKCNEQCPFLEAARDHGLHGEMLHIGCEECTAENFLK